MISLFQNSDPKTVNLEGTDVTVTIKRNARAKRMILRLDSKVAAGVVVTLPKRVPVSEALAMVRRKKEWILDKLVSQPEILPFIDGGIVPFRGREHRIQHHPEARGTVWLTDGVLNVAGKEAHLSRRLTDWLKKEAKKQLVTQTDYFSQQLGCAIGRITVRDTRTRWGSCSAQGNLSFSWRLILAPDDILAYVAAHEVAHLKEMNHSPQYWAVVGDIFPEYKAKRQWLKKNGVALHCYGKN